MTGFAALLLAGALLDWEWMMDHRRARRLTRLIGRSAARIVYVVLGAAGIVLGIVQTLGLTN